MTVNFPELTNKSDLTFADVPVGARVRVLRKMVDFYFFRGDETGVVVKNDGTYLGVIVEFDWPREFDDGYIQYQFNFNPTDLVLVEEAA